MFVLTPVIFNGEHQGKERSNEKSDEASDVLPGVVGKCAPPKKPRYGNWYAEPPCQYPKEHRLLDHRPLALLFRWECERRFAGSAREVVVWRLRRGRWGQVCHGYTFMKIRSDSECLSLSKKAPGEELLLRPSCEPPLGRRCRLVGWSISRFRSQPTRHPPFYVLAERWMSC